MSISGFNRKINWNDFKEIGSSKEPPRQAHIEAGYFTNLGSGKEIKVKKVEAASGGEVYKIVPSSLGLKVMIETTRSWVVKDGKSDDLLRHEQGHYDLAALGARDFQSRMLELEAATTDELKSQMGAVEAELADQLAFANQAYDGDLAGWKYRGTNHGLDQVMQSWWDTIIARLKKNPDLGLYFIASQ